MRGNKLPLGRFCEPTKINSARIECRQIKRQSERGAAFAKAGRAKMFGPQSAGPDAPGRTGKSRHWHLARALRAAANTKQSRKLHDQRRLARWAHAKAFDFT
jgi:hypothetical protein